MPLPGNSIVPLRQRLGENVELVLLKHSVIIFLRRDLCKGVDDIFTYQGPTLLILANDLVSFQRNAYLADRALIVKASLPLNYKEIAVLQRHTQSSIGIAFKALRDIYNMLC